MTTWTVLFDPVIKDAKGTITPRLEQEVLGQAIIDAFDTKTNLIAEAKTGTGKSYAALVPLINIIKTAPVGKKIRGVVSTETTTLQDQLIKKDLPHLHKIYGGFKYRVLKGRSNYLCFNALKLNASGNAMAAKYLDLLEKQTSRLEDGERGDVERVLKTELDDRAWSYLAGSAIDCGENQCSPDVCYSARARALALDADIVVVNHALLRVDADTIVDGDNFLGPINYLIVDEAHKLEAALISGWTEELTEWEITDMISKVTTAVDTARSAVRDEDMGYVAQNVSDDIIAFIHSVTTFYGLLHKDEDWDRVVDSISLKNVMAGSPAGLINAMRAYEEQGPKRLADSLARLEKIKKYLVMAKEKIRDEELSGLRPVSKGITAIKKLIPVITRISEAMKTRDGIVVEYGTPYGVTLTGYYRRDGKHTVRLSVVPLDPSQRAKVIWADRTCVLLSATLTDLTTGTFDYTADCLGFENYNEIRTGSPFDYAAQQIVYVTTGDREIVDVEGARYSFDELMELIAATGGRSLVLFTARKELDDAATRIRQLQAAGEFTWPVLVQEKDSNKQSLVNSFRSQETSVLLATKSFFTGVDFPGDTCSHVALCKFTLPQYNAICRMQIAWWRRRGYHKWYERLALEDFMQAAGRLIRTGNDRGVVSLLDYRVTLAGDRVANTARLGVESLGSGVTRSPEDVRMFLK